MSGDSTDATEVSLGGETIKGVLAKFTMAAVGFIGTVVFARVLGPTAFGAFYALHRLARIVDRPVLGWAVAAKKRFSEEGAPLSEVVGAQIFVIAGWSALVVIGTLAISDSLRSYAGLDTAPFLFVVLVLSAMFYIPFDPLVKARGLVGAASWVDTLRSYLTFPIQLGLILLFSLGTTGMVYGLAAATVLSAPLLWYYVAVWPALPSRATLWSLAAFARYSIPSTLVGRAYASLDVVLLGWLLTTEAVAEYEVALKLTMAALFVADTASEGLMARVSTLHSRGEPIAEDVSNTLAFASILAVPILFGAAAIPEAMVVTIYGSAYAEAAPLLVGLALYRLIRTQSLPLINTVNGLDQPRIVFRIAVATLLLNIPLALTLVGPFGAFGVVVATIVAESIRYVVLAWYVKRHDPTVRLLPRTLLEQFTAAIVMFGAVVGLHRLIPIRAWYHLVFLLAVGAAVYGLLLLALSDRLRHTLGSVVRGSRIESYVPHAVRRW